MRGMISMVAAVLVLVTSMACLGSVSGNKSAPPPASTPADAAGAPASADGPTGTVTVAERLDDERPTAMLRYVRARVAYENDTTRVFESIQIWCRAFDGDGWALGARSWVLTSAMLGPIEPGFRMREVIRITVEDDDVVDRIDCQVTAASAR